MRHVGFSKGPNLNRSGGNDEKASYWFCGRRYLGRRFGDRVRCAGKRRDRLCADGSIGTASRGERRLGWLLRWPALLAASSPLGNAVWRPVLPASLLRLLSRPVLPALQRLL